MTRTIETALQDAGGVAADVGTAKKRGRPPTLSQEQYAVLGEHLRAHPNATYEDAVEFVRARFGVTVVRQTITKHMKAIGISKVAAKTPARAADSVAGAKAPEAYGYRPHHRVPPSADRLPSSLTDAEWGLVADLFEARGPGRPAVVSTRAKVDAIAYIVRGGLSWRMLPKEFPKWDNVYATFRRWSASGLFEKMHDRLRAMWREREQRNVEPSGAVVDSQSVKTSPQGGPKGYDGGKKVVGRKRHLLVDTTGILLAVLLTPANVQDRDAAAEVVAAGKQKYPSIQVAYADSGYAGSKTAAAVAATGVKLEIVKRPNAQNQMWSKSGELPLFPAQLASSRPFPILPKRWIAERANAWTERPRRMNRDHDALLQVSTAWIWFVHGRMLLAKLAHLGTTAQS